MLKNKVNTKILSGFVELLPEKQFLFDEIKGIVEKSAIYKRQNEIILDTCKLGASIIKKGLNYGT